MEQLQKLEMVWTNPHLLSASLQTRYKIVKFIPVHEVNNPVRVCKANFSLLSTKLSHFDR